ncbi:cytochrome P450 [Actinoplanes sp. NBRC 14428]|nr:cytochrome P450 [Actinoplanes sp. NBRC 14428]
MASTAHRIRAIQALGAFRRDALGLFEDVARVPGGIAVTRAFGRELVFITHPDHVVHVLRDNHRNYSKDAPIYRVARPFLGNGLTVSPGGDDWLHRRRLVQPAFSRAALTGAARITEDCLADVAGHWTATALAKGTADATGLAKGTVDATGLAKGTVDATGLAKGTVDATGLAEGTVDATAEMATLSMRLACRILFGAELDERTAEVAADLRLVCDHVAAFLARPFPPLVVPTPANRRFRAAMRRIRATIAALVAEPRTELIAGLVADGESGGSTREQVADELLGLFFAGHETQGHTLAWCWQLLATHPAAQATLHDELEAVLGGRPPALEDLPSLPYTRQVVDEAMRLYPVVWIMMRRAIGADTIGGHPIAAGSLVAWSPYAGNRHPDVWKRPGDFWPGRFDDPGGTGAAYHRHSLAPFGIGPRSCPGSNLALNQACLTIATLAQRCRVAPVRDGPVGADPSLTLRPAEALRLRLTSW